MAYPLPSSHATQGPPREAPVASWRHQGQASQDEYQQDYSQDGYEDYQDYGNGYGQYNQQPHYDAHYQDTPSMREPSKGNAYSQDVRQDSRSGQGYGDYNNGYQETPRDPRVRPNGHGRPPPRHHPGGPGPRPTNGARGGPPRPGHPRGPPPPMNGYGPGPGPGPRPPRDPRDPRGMRSPPRPHDRRHFPHEQAPTDRSQSAGRGSRDQAGYDDVVQQPPFNARGHGSWEQGSHNEYNNHPTRYGSNDQQQQFDSRRPPGGGRQPMSPQSAPPRDHNSNQRPGTATGARGAPPQLDIPQQSRTQPTTPVGGAFSPSYAAEAVSSPAWQERNSATGYERDWQSSLPARPGTAPGRPQPEYDNPKVRSASPEEMPAFERSSAHTEPGALHTGGGKAASTSEYVPYSPQDGPSSQNGPGSYQNSQAMPYNQPRSGSLPQSRPYGSPPPNPNAVPPSARPPLRRTATEGDEQNGNGEPPGARQGYPSNYPAEREQFAPGPNGQFPPTLNRQANSFNEQTGHSPRSAGGPGPDRRNAERPNFYPTSRGGPGGPSGPNPQRGQGPPTNGAGSAPRSNTAPNPRAEGNRPEQPQHSLDPSAPKGDPDALPHHPVPVRPGLAQNGSSNERSTERQKPPPVRQYTRDSTGRTTTTVAAKSGPVTLEEISRLRAAVSENPADKAAKLILAKKLSEASVVLADDGGRADMRMLQHNRDRFNKEGLEIVKTLVASEYTDAMFFMAECYGEGALGLRSDSKDAFVLYQNAAKLGHPAAAYRTAVCCEIGAEEGGGTRRDPQKAVQWYRHASSLGDVPATYKMGVILLKGLLGQEKNLGEAITFLKSAADDASEENPHAVHELAMLYEQANGWMPPDEKQALDLYKRAAKLGYKFSQYKLGQAYEYGQLGCPVDARNSIVWYSKAAAQGEHQSELALSGWYLTGSEGILEHNDTEAYLWARKAAKADPPLAKAMFAMGYFTEIGIGCPKSLDEAKKWYARSASNKHPKAQERLDELRRGGSKVQRNREKLSRSNQKQNEENCVVM